MPNTCQTIEDWVAFLTKTDVPVLQKSIDAIDAFRQNMDNVTIRELSRVALDDPMMTLRVMSLLQRYRGRSSMSSGVTTFGRVMMMIGIQPFFEYFQNLSSIEALLANDLNAHDNVLNVIDRSRYASRYALDIADQRFDIDRYEVQIATLLHSMAEIALWCFAAPMMRKIRALQLRYRNMRSASIQQYVLGFTFNQLQTEMAQAWKLPELLVDLMDESQSDNPRVKTVTYSTDLARHSMNGLDDPALPDDYLNISNLLGQDLEEVLVRIAAIRQSLPSVRHADETALTTGDRCALAPEDIARFEQYRARHAVAQEAQAAAAQPTVAQTPESPPA